MPGPNVWGSMSPVAGPSGIVAFIAGSSVGVLSDPRITVSSLVFWVPASADAANRRVINSVCIAGQCTVTLDGAVTGAQSWGYIIVTPQTVS